MVAENECKKLAVTATKNFSTDWRNKEEYKIALKRLLVEGMGGVIINNCKSGKDRTGLSEIYQHAMIHSLKNTVILVLMMQKDHQDNSSVKLYMSYILLVKYRRLPDLTHRVLLE